MNKERKLAWALGALSATAVAVAITAVSSNKAAPPVPPPLAVSQSTPLPVAQVPAAAPAAAIPVAATAAVVADVPEQQADPAAQVSTVQAQAAPESPAPNGQIWACTTKGVKTFSNNPCGEKSTLLEVGPINTMNATPAVHYARNFPAQSHYAAASDANYSADQESYADQAGAETGGNTYAIVQGGFVVRRRPEHPHHRPMPNHHNSGPMPRKY